jgi:hypothetical protein
MNDYALTDTLLDEDDEEDSDRFQMGSTGDTENFSLTIWAGGCSKGHNDILEIFVTIFQ